MTRSFFLNGFIASIFYLSLIVIVFISSGILLASDLSDATELRAKCETEFKTIEVPAKNFGNYYVKQNYKTATDLLKEGKIKLAQSKYQDAIAIYNKYQQLQNDMYKELAKDYISRAETIYNDTAVELVDFIDNDKVSQYFRLANQNVVDAKKASTAGNYKLVIETCRTSKKYSFESYKAAGKAIPDKYKKDVKDNNKELE